MNFKDVKKTSNSDSNKGAITVMYCQNIFLL